MGENLYNLYPDKDPKLVEEIKDDLNTLSKIHVYFEFLRLELLDKLEQAEKQGFIKTDGSKLSILCAAVKDS